VNNLSEHLCSGLAPLYNISGDIPRRLDTRNVQGLSAKAHEPWPASLDLLPTPNYSRSHINVYAGIDEVGSSLTPDTFLSLGLRTRTDDHQLPNDLSPNLRGQDLGLSSTAHPAAAAATGSLRNRPEYSLGVNPEPLAQDMVTMHWADTPAVFELVHPSLTCLVINVILQLERMEFLYSRHELGEWKRYMIMLHSALGASSHIGN
jgi:hypothetical protein